MEANERRQAQNEVSTSRLQTLTDGIFAIAMTILVFGLSIPSDVSPERLLAALGKLWPNLLSFLISFVILGVYWVATHTEFQYIRRADHVLIWLNIFFLLGISLVPFSANVLGRYPSQQIAVVLYGSNLLFCLAFHYSMWRHATKEHHLVDADLDPRMIRFGALLAAFPSIGYALAIVLSFASTWISIVLYALVPIPYILGLFYRRIGIILEREEKSESPALHPEHEVKG